MIFVAGENLIDTISYKNNKNIFKTFVGGSTLNTALALGRLKSNVYFFSRISNDFFGKTIIEHLKKSNVKLNLIQKTNDQTTVAFVSNKKKPEFIFYSNKTAFRNLSSFSLSNTTLRKIKLSHFSSISLALQPSADTLMRMIKYLKKNSKSIISIDPNIRPGIIENKKWYLSRFKEFLKYGDIIKMSDEDFRYISHKKYDDEIIKWINKYKICVFILTLGKSGSILYTKNIKIKLSALKIKTIDTVGAGDCFIAAVIYYLEKSKNLSLNSINKLSKDNWKNCINFATLVSSKNCEREGCDPPLLKEVIKTMKLDK